MIVKNEEKYIKRGILSFLKCADEVVVVDTGSSDNTIKEIESIADARIKLYEMEWPFNFSVARNKAMSYTTSDFVLSMDGDEYFDDRLISTFNRLKNNDFYGCNYVNLNLENFSEGVSYGIRHGERVVVAKSINPQFRYCVHEKIYCEGGLKIYDMSTEEGLIVHTHDGNLWGGFDTYRQMYFNEINNISSYDIPRTSHYQYYLHYTMQEVDKLLSLRALSKCYGHFANNSDDYDYRMELYRFNLLSPDMFIALLLTNTNSPDKSDNKLISKLYSQIDIESNEFLIISDYILNNAIKNNNEDGIEDSIVKMFNSYCLKLYKNMRISEYLESSEIFLKRFPNNEFAINNSNFNNKVLIPKLDSTMVVIVENKFTPSTLYYTSQCFKNAAIVNLDNSHQYSCENINIERFTTIESAIENARDKGFKYVLTITPDKPIYVSEFSEIFNIWLNADNFTNSTCRLTKL